LPTDPHLADLIELRCLAQDTPSEAYGWRRRLDEMIRVRQAALDMEAVAQE